MLCLGATAIIMARSTTKAITATGGVAQQKVGQMRGIATSTTIMLTSTVTTTIRSSGFLFAVSGI